MIVSIVGWYAFFMAVLTFIAQVMDEDKVSNDKKLRHTIIWVAHTGFLAVAVLALK